MNSELLYVDCETHVLLPEWCRASFRPPSDEHVITRLIYDHPDREVALSQAAEEGLLREMDRAGIDRAIIMGLPWRSAELCWRNNEYVAGLVRRYPHRFWGAGLLPPLDSESPSEAVMRIADMGLRGVKVIPSWQGWRLDDPRFTPALETIEAQRMFLEPHTDYSFMPQEEGDPPSALFSVLRRHPELRVVAPHLAGMLCLHALHPGFRDVFRNVLLVGSVPTTMRFIEFAAAAAGSDSIAFGSDFPFNPSHDQLSVRDDFERLDLTLGARASIAGQNALRFLNACR
jgi:uncharacterized protein